MNGRHIIGYQLQAVSDKDTLYCCSFLHDQISPEYMYFSDGKDILCQPYCFETREEAFWYWETAWKNIPAIRNYKASIEEYEI